MERNKVKIICNPYKKTITYKRWIFDENDGVYKWDYLGSKSKLIIDKKYTNATIQHNAYEIVSEIVDEYNRGNVGLDIIFEGTKEDYNDLKEVVDEFFSEFGVTCERGDFYINSASEVMPQIQNSFKNLSEFFKEYTSDKANKVITKFSEATKTEIPICVVGMYSTGKSAFINALIGAEILPSSVNPTTARNYKIIESDKNGLIRFSLEGEKIVISYEEDKYNISGNIDKTLKNKIHKRLEELDKSELTSNMYHSLCIINEYANETKEDEEKRKKISELIEIEVPFYNGVLINDKYKFIIFDTPGSDSQSHKEHLEVLKKALGEQTNGLPILLTSPKDMDRTGADKLLEIVNGIDGSLDLTNAMIIVNQADSVAGNSLNKIKKGTNTILAKWKSNRLYFLSAIMGLGSKKDNYDDEESWIDEDYSEIFLDKIESFTSEGIKRYKQLYTHNQMAISRKNKYDKSIEDKKEERELLYINSGLHCIEKEIIEFADKYALYNKCSQAQEYLSKAIEYTKKEINEIESEKKDVKKELECTQDNYDDEESWIDEDYSEIFLDKIESFTSEGIKRYKQLYTHNQMAISRKNKYDKSIEDKKEERELLYINSGLHCIEKEIIEFADKYALYNKCSQAQEYLSKAIEYTKKEINEIESEKKDVKKELECTQDIEKRDLIRKLNEEIKKLTDKYTGDYSPYISKVVHENIDNSKKEINAFVNDNWNRVKSDRKELRIHNFLKYSRIDFLKEADKCRQQIIINSRSYWEKNKSELQYKCCILIKDDKNLTNEEQKFLEKFIMNLSVPIGTGVDIDISEEDVSKHLVNIFGKKFLQLSRIDPKKTIKLYCSSLENQIRIINNKIIDYHSNQFKKWNYQLKDGLEKEIINLNPKLKEYSNKLEDLHNRIERIQAQQNFIENEKRMISKMFELKEREDFECQQ